MSLLVKVNQTGQRYARMLKAYLAYGLWQLGFKQWGQHAPFYMLRYRLMRWNQQRVAQRQAPSAIGMQEISAIRAMITEAEQASATSVSPALLDQWFFLAVGAMQVQAQTGVNKAWYLFDQSVHSQLGGQSFYRTLSIGFVVSLCVAWMSVATPNHKPAQTSWSPLEEAPAVETGRTADPVTLSLLNLAYQKMQNGSCELPQAAMLPEIQRQAFIMFVTQGTVDVDHVEHLRQALGYVSCLYPQELMRPQGRERLTRS